MKSFLEADISTVIAGVASPMAVEQVIAVLLLILPVAAVFAYLVLAGSDLQEGVAALRNRRPCWRKLLKGLAYVVLFLKLLMA